MIRGGYGRGRRCGASLWSLPKTAGVCCIDRSCQPGAHERDGEVKRTRLEKEVESPQRERERTGVHGVHTSTWMYIHHQHVSSLFDKDIVVTRHAEHHRHHLDLFQLSEPQRLRRGYRWLFFKAREHRNCLPERSRYVDCMCRDVNQVYVHCSIQSSVHGNTDIRVSVYVCGKCMVILPTNHPCDLLLSRLFLPYSQRRLT